MTLLDANLLIALSDPLHVHRPDALRLMQSVRRSGWATCPLTENAFLRIVGNPNYPDGPGTPVKARRLLSALLTIPGHQFWTDDLSLADSKAFPLLPGPGQLTDLYLLALAVKRGGRLATLDRRIDPSLVAGGASAYWLVS